MADVPRIGTEFAGYRIEGLLGRGGMSVVYRAENARLGNKVALKLLSEELANDESFRERFVRESRTAATLNHPNIVTIYDAGDEDGVLYIAMRYVESDLKQLLTREGPLSVVRMLSVVGQTGSALDAAHARGLLHRDVKPANILLDLTSEPGGVPHSYLADFGLTKHLESRSGITASGQFVGTIDYMSPEQIEGRDVDRRTDIYSLGCVVFESLVGTTPFRRETDVAVLWAHMREDPPPISEVRADLPRELDDVLGKAMAKAPEERHPSCRELVADLRRVLGTVSAATVADRTRPESVAGAAPTQAARTVLQAREARPQGSPRRRWLLVALAVGGVAAALGYALGARGDQQAKPTRQLTESPPPATPAARPPEEALTPNERVLLQKVPAPIRAKCDATEPPSLDFLASVVCRRPGKGIIKVQYSEAESGARNNRYFDKRIRSEQTSAPGTLSSAVNCHTPPPIRQWVIVGSGAHRPEPHSVGGRGYTGRFICYQSNWWSAIEWTDARVDVYAIAYARDPGRLLRWWRSKAGPVRAG